MKWRERSLEEIANMICGDYPNETSNFKYRTGYDLTKFFRELDTTYIHDGSTRRRWVADTLSKVLNEPHRDEITPPDTFIRIIRALMDPEDARNEGPERGNALILLNNSLKRERFEVFYAGDEQYYLRHLGTKQVISPDVNPHRPLSKEEQERRNHLKNYINNISEDELTEEVLLPLFKQLGFSQVRVTGHKDKALEYGKDIWMNLKLPTRHTIYFGVQVKKNKLDSAAESKTERENVATVLNQVRMMLEHEVFDSELNRNVLVDHAYIISAGEITNAAKTWLTGQLSRAQRSQILFMDHDSILNLFVTSSLPLPAQAIKTALPTKMATKPNDDTDFFWPPTTNLSPIDEN